MTTIPPLKNSSLRKPPQENPSRPTLAKQRSRLSLTENVAPLQNSPSSTNNGEGRSAAAAPTMSPNPFPSTVPKQPNLSRTADGGPTFVKIISLAIAKETEDDGSGGGGLSAMPLITLEFPSSNSATFRTDTKLADVRSKLEHMMQTKRGFKFCIDDCSVVPEDLTLEAYSKMLHEPSADSTIIVYVVATSESRPSQAAVLLKPPFLLKFILMGDTPSSATNAGSLHSSAFRGKDPTPMPLRELRRLVGKMSTNPQMHTFCSLDGSAAGDELSLKDYLGIDSESVSEDSGTPSVIIRYRKTDAKVSAAASKFHGASPQVLAALEQMKFDPNFKDRSAEELHVDTTALKVNEEINPSQIAARDANPLKHTSQMDENDWDHVLRNCSLLYGWRIDKKTNAVVRATTPAFRLRNNVQVPTPLPELAREEHPSGAEREGESQGVTPAALESPSADGQALVLSSAKLEKEVALRAEDLDANIPAKLGVIPSYTINDRSRIEITAITSEFQESMAKNHFSASSVEASVSGGYAGFSVGVTGGVAKESSSSQTNTNKNFAKRMVANYMFPRVSVFLRPEDLEPTQELREAIELVRRTKNINALRKLHANFGHLFSHEAVLGGSLQTTKVVTGTENSSLSKEKESFKASVGVAVSTPFGIGGSMKASHETQDGKEDFKRNLDTRESMVFEATGGNTLLAADPPAWSGSVSDFNTWRVISQSDVGPMVETIAQIPGYQEIRSWFFRAVPKLSEYVIIPETRVLYARFKVTTQSGSIAKISGREEQAYLGHDPENPPMPYKTSLERKVPIDKVALNVMFGSFGPIVDLTHTTTQVEVESKDAMFFPYKTQAPVLMFPSGDSMGTATDPALMQTVWRLEIATGYSLGAETLISIKSMSRSDVTLGLSVYRNAQGVFLPGITSTDEPSYWRFEKLSNDSLGAKEPFKHGQDIRLTWRFSDQASGFRDYYDDVFGRKNAQRPKECPSDVLYLKSPYPRFENPSEKTMGIVMSPAATTEPVIAQFKTSSKVGGHEISLNLHDLPFRLDTVGNDGVGDAADFMNVISNGHYDSSSEKVIGSWVEQGKSPMEQLLSSNGPEALIAGLVLGPVAAPITAIGSILGSILGL